MKTKNHLKLNYQNYILEIYRVDVHKDNIENVQTDRHDTQADIIEAFNSTSRYDDDLLNIDNLYFEGMVTQIYPKNCKRTKLILRIPKLNF